MGNIIKAPRGTQDILTSESYLWRFLEGTMLEIAGLYGFSEIRTPTFEDMSLFKRSVGDSTDVVQKEMYEVRAEKGDDLYGLKPEGTAGVVRSAIEHSLLKEALPLKVCYVTQCFRHERPQAGRLREFHQFGIEMFGAQSASADAEIISVAKNILDVLGLKNVNLFINSIGCPTCREEYHKALKEYFAGYKDELCGTCIERLDKNPMRILDCKCPSCKEIADKAPIVLNYLCDECKEHFESVKTRLTSLGIEFTIKPSIVRGLDYYTKTVFEFVASDLGAQSTVCGGGRYDGLVEQMGGAKTPALGFAMGLERLLLVIKAQEIDVPKPLLCELYIASMGDNANIKAHELTNMLRRDGFYVECDSMQRSFKAQLKYANKIGASLSMVIGDTELESSTAKLKDMKTGEEKKVSFDTLSEELTDAGLDRMADELAGEYGDNALAEMMGLKG